MSLGDFPKLKVKINQGKKIAQLPGVSPGLGLDKILLFLRRPAPSGGTLRNWALSLPERW